MNQVIGKINYLPKDKKSLFKISTILKFLLSALLMLGFTCGFSQKLTFEAPEVLFEYPFSGLKAKFDYPLIPLDADNDGDVDFIGGLNNSQYFFKNLGNGEFNTTEILQGNGRSPLKVLDYDNDQDLDVILERSVLINENNDQFTSTVFNSQWVNYTAEVADFNQDGFFDFVYHYSATGDDVLTIWYSNNSNDDFTVDTIHTEYVDFGDLDIGDIDADGDIDIAVSISNSDDQVLVMINDIDSFKLEVIPEIFTWASKSMQLTDLDGDNDLD